MPGTSAPPGVWAVTFAQVMLSAPVAVVMVCKLVVFIAGRSPLAGRGARLLHDEAYLTSGVTPCGVTTGPPGEEYMSGFR
jgi:hypothetical protein